MKQYEKQKHSDSETNKMFFFSRKFLSFSKEEATANVFFTNIQFYVIIQGVYVLLLWKELKIKISLFPILILMQ